MSTMKHASLDLGTVRCWRKEDGVIYFEVTSNGMTGPEWIEWFEQNGIQISPGARDVLLSSGFKPTKGVTYRIAVLKGILFTDSDRITGKIYKEADRRQWQKPSAEVACLIRKLFSDEKLVTMGLLRGIVVLHDSSGSPLLTYSELVKSPSLSTALCSRIDGGWGSAFGFAFVVSQVSSS